MQSLAEFLGAMPDCAPDDPLPAIGTAQDFCLRIVESREYRLSIYNRIAIGNMPPAVECRILDGAFGKPPQRIDLADVTSLEDLTPEAVREKLERVERMLRLLQAAQADDEVDSTAGSIELEPSVH